MTTSRQKPIALTGIKASGTPHLGNYLGAILPAKQLAESHELYVFIADYHGITSAVSADELRQSILEISATWLACGIDPEKVVFYRQSDIPEIFELNWALSCMAPKGLLNRAHAYKAKRDQNVEENRDPDYHISLGLFAYPVLMAADILAFQANDVPVGPDQKQHVEIARDIANTSNKQYKQEIFTLPTPQIQAKSILGTDGRKMSKSYKNTLPLFAEEKKLRKAVMKIQTDSKDVDEVKDPTTCTVFQLYKEFASADAIAELEAEYLAPGMGYGHAKQKLFDAILEHVGPYQEKYNALISKPDEIQAHLDAGAKKARAAARDTLDNLRSAIGLAG